MSILNSIDLRSYQSETSQHSHNFAQLVLPIKGILDIEIGSSSGIADQDTAAFITAGQNHCFSGRSDNLFLVVDLKDNYQIHDKLFNSPFCELDLSSKKLISFIQSYLEQGLEDTGTENLISSLLINVLNKNKDGIHDTKVLKAKNWLDHNFSQAIDIKNLAQHCYLSTSQLQRQFKKSMGYTLGSYWRNKKMEHAKLLLSTTSLSIEIISLSLGYDYLSSFTRLFSQHYLISPSQWREMTFYEKKTRVLNK